MTTSVAKTTIAMIKQEDSLTDLQVKFVHEFFLNGGDGVAAARTAGYANPEVSAHENRRSLIVQRALFKERQSWISGTLAVQAMATMRDLMLPENPPNIRLGAAKWALEASGHVAPKENPHHAPVSVNSHKQLNEMTISELEQFISENNKKVNELQVIDPVDVKEKNDESTT